MMLALPPLVTDLLPELILVIGASVILMAGLAMGRSRPQTDWAFGAAVLTTAAAFSATWWLAHAIPQPCAALCQDGMVWYARQVGLAVGLLILLANRHVGEPGERGEFLALILYSLAGVLLVASANDLILLFLALELVSIPTYVLIGLSRRAIQAQEATGKYFFLGAFAAAITLYGFSFLYGASGTMRMFGSLAPGASIRAALSQPDAMADAVVLLGLALSLAGLAFKIAAVPLHFYVADVYQGAAAPVAGMLGFVPKFAGFVAIIRILSLSGWTHGPAVFWLLWILAVATMFVGNTLALMQHNVKRILAYSSIAHSGYMLVAVVAGPSLLPPSTSPMSSGPAAMLFYIAVYGIMNLGAFTALAYFRKPGEDEEDSAETLEDLAGTARRHPWAALAMAVCILGLMGFPLTGGFFGKVYVFSAALSSDAASGSHQAMVVLVTLAVINSAIAAAYYLRILAACYLRTPTAEMKPSRCSGVRLALAMCAVLVVAVFLVPGRLFDKAGAAAADVPSVRATPPPQSLTAVTAPHRTPVAPGA